MALIRGGNGKRFLAGFVGLAVIGTGVWFAIDWYREKQIARGTDAHIQEIIAMLGLAGMPNFHQRIDKVRTFINDNSQHKIDQAFRANQGNAAAFAGGVLAHAKGEAEPVHMECSTRSNLMGRVLSALGYETRMVAIFDSQTNLKSHSFLEVLNPKTGLWETQDADYDIYWRNIASTQRISLAEAAEAIDEIEPCGREGCGWEHESREGIRAQKLKSYLDIITIKGKDVRYALYTSRADLSRTYSKGQKKGAFCDVEAKRCKLGFFDIRIYSSYGTGFPR
jgi:hypothetical protein